MPSGKPSGSHRFIAPVLGGAMIIVALAGCGSGDEGAVKAAAPMNPSGVARNEQEATMQKAQVEAGQKLNSTMTEAARAEAAAKARTGGK